ncbi:hypothetical protein EMIHUDRAFT_117229 [Emiliania huxleyi CCMP1516]|uniref:Mitochondrial cardiolipin hydrolase n=2 Tax=Emiliania huxleyi TaxID=2903 RepID=A0A0D3IZR3_EMIH1|nr:phospholipase D [Emiliania huxleyi CCMP1516]XP_005773765.1 hypothetical protein EMIHUDRAFT_117229 [Emiliania huxleyi CCMP1516]EOD16748.1 phospholipase D [Emiliania huxleyi CCMP1516]EOD21336.1 hypothetical protein EMIHUDRAFT_117229 [Emiliania huxleyi CCMP1516]|eukprot:XP_005769177.1 phospholipase D [Emiliania huxleyi CCMP1516]
MVNFFRRGLLATKKKARGSPKATTSRFYYFPDSAKGKLIGRGGGTIKGLSATYSVTIDTDQSGVIEVAGVEEKIEECRVAIEDLMKMRVSGDTPCRVTFDLQKERDESFLGKLRANRYRSAALTSCPEASRALPQAGSRSTSHRITNKVEQECLLLDLEVPGSDNKFSHVTAVGAVEDCLKACDMLASELELGTLAYTTTGAGVGEAGYSTPPQFDLLTSRAIAKALFFPGRDEEPGPYHPDADPGEEKSLSTLAVALKYLDSANKSIDVAVFNITEDRLTQRLLDAHRHRGVRVRVITDDEQAKQTGSDAARLREAGVPLEMDADFRYHMHHKFACLDGAVLLNGSFNWTRQASEHNNENLVITNDSSLVAAFHSQFETLWKGFEGTGDAQAPATPPPANAPAPSQEEDTVFTACPKCGGPIYDNREANQGRKNPWPSFKCKDTRGCQWCEW